VKSITHSGQKATRRRSWLWDQGSFLRRILCRSLCRIRRRVGSTKGPTKGPTKWGVGATKGPTKEPTKWGVGATKGGIKANRHMPCDSPRPSIFRRNENPGLKTLRSSENAGFCGKKSVGAEWGRANGIPGGGKTAGFGQEAAFLVGVHLFFGRAAQFWRRAARGRTGQEGEWRAGVGICVGTIYAL